MVWCFLPFAVSLGTWLGGAWVPGGPRPVFRCCLCCHDPDLAFLILHQDVSHVSRAQWASPQFENHVQIFTSHLPMMNLQDQVTLTNWPASKKNFQADLLKVRLSLWYRRDKLSHNLAEDTAGITLVISPHLARCLPPSLRQLRVEEWHLTTLAWNCDFLRAPFDQYGPVAALTAYLETVRGATTNSFQDLSIETASVKQPLSLNARQASGGGGAVPFRAALNAQEHAMTPGLLMLHCAFIIGQIGMPLHRLEAFFQGMMDAIAQ